MALDPATEDIAVLSTHRYRAESVALAVAGRSGHNTFAFTQPDAGVLAAFSTLLIDLDAPLDSILELIRTITMQHPQVKVVVLGLVESEESVVKLAEAGASGYVPPATSLQGLVTILQSVQKGEFTCPPHITYALFSHLTRLASNRAAAVPQGPVLSTREHKVLELVSQNLTNKEIAARLCISEYTAKNHVHRILKKLGLRNRGLASRALSFRWPLASITLGGFSKLDG